MGKKPNRRKEPKKAESVDQGVESSSPNRERLASEDARSRESEPRDGRVRIALVGAGKAARQRYVPVLLRHPAFHLKAAWAAQRKAGDLLNDAMGQSLDLYIGESGFEELVNSREVDAFVVVKPRSVALSPIGGAAAASKKFTARLLDAGRPVMSHLFGDISGSDSASIRQVESLGQQYATGANVWMVTDVWAREPSLLAVASRAVETGLMRISAYADPLEWELMDLCRDIVLVAEAVLGGEEPAVVAATCSMHGTDDTLSGVLEAQNGCCITVAASTACPGPALRVDIVGPDGCLSMEEQDGFLVGPAGASRVVGLERQLDAFRDAIRAARGRGKAKSLFPDLRDALQRQLRATTVAASMIASNGTKIKLHG